MGQTMDQMKMLNQLRKAQKELNFKATHNLEDMCRDTIRWQEENKNGYEE